MMWNRTRGYIFTNKVHSQKGIMSTILGLLSLITLGTAVYFSYLHKGEPSVRLATAALLASVFMVIGLVLGVFSVKEQEKFWLFRILGIVMNVLSFIVLSLILFAGAYID